MKSKPRVIENETANFLSHLRRAYHEDGGGPACAPKGFTKVNFHRNGERLCGNTPEGNPSHA